MSAQEGARYTGGQQDKEPSLAQSGSVCVCMCTQAHILRHQVSVIIALLRNGLRKGAKKKTRCESMKKKIPFAT